MNLEQLRTTLPERLVKIAQSIREAGGRSFLVGGWVRDAVLGRPSRDFDVEVYGLGQDELLALLARYGHPNLVGKSYGVINLYSKGMQFDFSFPRLESKIGVGHRAFAVETRPDLDFHTAALRRDFTINAMGMELPDLRLEDPHGGLRDLELRLLRHVGPAFSEDSLRVLRAVQFAARFDLKVAPETIALCRTLDLRELSCERLYEEFRKWLVKASLPSRGLVAFVAMDLQRFFPWIVTPAGWSWDGFGIFLDHLARERGDVEVDAYALMLAGLCAGCPTESEVLAFLGALTQENAILRQVPAIWREAPVIRSALRDFALKLPDPWLRRLALRLPIPQALRYLRAWSDATGEFDGETLCVKIAGQARALGIWDHPPEPYLTGRILMELGLSPGRFFGEWIAECFEEQLEGRIADADAARAWALRKTATGPNYSAGPI